LRDLRRKYTKFNFGWRSAPIPARGAYSALPDLLAEIQGPTSRIGKKKGEEGRWEGKREWERRGGEGGAPSKPKSCLRHRIHMLCSAMIYHHCIVFI